MSDLFNEKAQDWDANDMVKNLSEAVGSSILRQVTFTRQMDVLDFGAGTGLISSHVAPLVNRIVAVDISESMLQKLLEKPQLQGKVEAVCQNILEQPLSRQFDLIMSAMALHHVEHTHELMQCFARHLKPGAKVSLADLDKEDGSFHPEGTEGVFHSGFGREQLASLMQQHGFEDIQFVTAHTVNKEGKEYPIFLLTATRQ